jgi:predicted transcriptional regulator
VRYVAINLEPELVNLIDQLARQNERSRASMIRLLLRQVTNYPNYQGAPGPHIGRDEGVARVAAGS